MATAGANIICGNGQRIHAGGTGGMGLPVCHENILQIALDAFVLYIADIGDGMVVGTREENMTCRNAGSLCNKGKPGFSNMIDG